MKEEYVIQAENLTKRFGNFTAVDHITFNVRKGEIFGFLGANGAGKTTAMRMLCGLSRPTEGKGTVAGTRKGKAQYRLYESEILLIRRPESMGEPTPVRRNLWYEG